MLNSYFITNKHNLFDCKYAISLMKNPKFLNLKDQRDTHFELKKELTTLE